jgi:membrane protease YdiL (CAAX protease family)
MMKTLKPLRPRTSRRPPLAAALMTLAVLSLTIYHYWMRVERMGLSEGGGAWAPLTGRPLSATGHLLAAALLLGLVPLLGARLGGLRLTQVGLGGFRRRTGLLWITFGVPAAVLAGKLAAASPAMRLVYPVDRDLTASASSFLPSAGLLLLYYVAWELLFRGILLLGLRERLGDGNANALQTALSVMAHFAHPPLETLAAVPAGLVFGGITLRTRSIWPVVVIHWTAGVAMNWFLVTSG